MVPATGGSASRLRAAWVVGTGLGGAASWVWPRSCGGGGAGSLTQMVRFGFLGILTGLLTSLVPGGGSVSDIKHLVEGVPGRWTTMELRVAELLRLGAAPRSVAVELGVNIKQVESLKKRKGFNDLLGITVGPVAGYAERWQEIRERQLALAGKALDTIEEAIDRRDEDGQVDAIGLRAAEGLIKSLEKGVAKESDGGSKELRSFMARLEEIAVKEAAAGSPRVVDVSGS